MVILTLIDVQYLQKVAFSFEESSNGQNQYFSGSHFPVKKFSQQNLPFPTTRGSSPNFLTLFGKPWGDAHYAHPES